MNILVNKISVFIVLFFIFMSVCYAKNIKIIGIDDDIVKSEIELKIINLLEADKITELEGILEQYDLEIDAENTTDEELLLNKRSKNNNLDFELYAAVSKNDVNKTKSLLANPSVDVNSFNGNEVVQWTPLMVSVYHGFTEIGKLLIESGADLNLIDRGGLKKTALAYAIDNDDFDIVKLLVENGASLTQGSGKDNEPPLFDAVENNNYQITEYLISACTETSV